MMPTVKKPPPRRLGRPRDCDSADTRARLLTAARAAFARDGYGNATNKDIADAAGITTGAIYHYFPSKADLYVAVVEEGQRNLQIAYEEISTRHHTLLDRFAALLDHTVEVSRRDPDSASLILAVYTEMQLHPELREPVRSLRWRSLDIVAAMVADARQNDEIPADVDDEALQDLLNAMIAGLRRLSASPDRIERHASAVALLQRLLAEHTSCSRR